MKHIKLFEAFVNEGEKEQREITLAAIEKSDLDDKLKKMLSTAFTKKVISGTGTEAYVGTDKNLYIHQENYGGWGSSNDLPADDDTPGQFIVKITSNMVASTISKEDYAELLGSVIKVGSPNLLASESYNSELDETDIKYWKGPRRVYFDDEAEYLDALLWSDEGYKIKEVLKKLGVNVNAIPNGRTSDTYFSPTGEKYSLSDMEAMAREIYPDDFENED